MTPSQETISHEHECMHGDHRKYQPQPQFQGGRVGNLMARGCIRLRSLGSTSRRHARECTVRVSIVLGSSSEDVSYLLISELTACRRPTPHAAKPAPLSAPPGTQPIPAHPLPIQDSLNSVIHSACRSTVTFKRSHYISPHVYRHQDMGSRARMCVSCDSSPLLESALLSIPTVPCM